MWHASWMALVRLLPKSPSPAITLITAVLFKWKLSNGIRKKESVFLILHTFHYVSHNHPCGRHGWLQQPDLFVTCPALLLFCTNCQDTGLSIHVYFVSIHGMTFYMHWFLKASSLAHIVNQLNLISQNLFNILQMLVIFNYMYYLLDQNGSPLKRPELGTFPS